MFLKVYADDRSFKTETQQLAADKAYAFTVKLKPGLIKYAWSSGQRPAGTRRCCRRSTNMVCGDAYLIDGQSNALATDTGEKSPPETNDWIRSYGGPTGRGDARDWVRDRFGKAKNSQGPRPNLWCNPVWKARTARRRNLATGAWNWPSDWWQARRCRSSSSTGRSAAPASTNTSRRRPIPAT